MDNPANVQAFHEAGREDGVMAPVYLFHAAQVSGVVRPGETVVDLGCGPANQLGLVARLNPDVHFIGVDLSEEMLAQAALNLQARGVNNVELRRGDITVMNGFDDASVDAVMSTVVLHHLPDQTALFNCFAQVARILKPGGGLYMVDFGHLKTEAAIRHFAYQYEDRQPELFTLDYLYSLRAAFDKDTWRQGHDRYLASVGKLYATFVVPYMVSIRSPLRRSLSPELKAALKAQRESMPHYHQVDIKDLMTFFRLGGLNTPGL
jgi:ubiquinone/menaquinone biosynthesis C-methylase UbiE